jgi:hypothetical protein
MTGRASHSRAESKAFDAALKTIAPASYMASRHPDSIGMEFAKATFGHRSVRHIRPIGGGFPQFAFVLNGGRVFAVVKENRDAAWQSAVPAQPTSRDVGITVPGLRAPARLKGKKNA